MRKKLILLTFLVLVMGLAESGWAAFLNVDIAYPIARPEDPNHEARYLATGAGGWLHWAQPRWWDLQFHDAVMNNGTGGEAGWNQGTGGTTWWDNLSHPGVTGPGIAGSGIYAQIRCGYEGDTSLKVYGMWYLTESPDSGVSIDPGGVPVGDPICNSYIISHSHWGNQPENLDLWRTSNGSLFLQFFGGGLVKGNYTLTSYHNCPNNTDYEKNSTWYPPDWVVDDGNDRIMPYILAFGPGVEQLHDEECNDVNVPIHWYTSDGDLLANPSLVKFYYSGVGDVTIMYKAADGSDGRKGGAAVLNAFILEGGDRGMATYPRPGSGQWDVHPDVVLLWKPGLYADFHTVYFGTDFNDVNDSLPAVLVSERQEPNEYDPNDPDTDSPHLKLGETYYWRVYEVNDFNDLSPWKGMVWEFTIDDGKAEDPNTDLPGIDPNAPQSKTLAWTPGTFATSHDLYFGADSDDVNDANTTSPEFVGTFYMSEGNDANIFQIPDDFGLELGESYHWRVDEHNSVYGDSKGDVWGLNVQNYLVIDDFESYGIVSNTITDTWYDGIRFLLVEPWFDYINGAALGLGARYPEMEDKDPVKGGLQSMWYSYNNTGQLYSWTFDYYSEATLPFDPPKDLTEYGVTALVVWFYGDPLADANVPQCQMYMALGDDSNNLARVDYGHYPGQDMNDILEEEWFEWNLDIQDFRDQGVDVCDVNKINIGFGYRDSNVPGGIGDIYFDNLRVYLPRCVATILKPSADISSNCKVDIADVAIVARDWLLCDFTVTTEAPPAGPLVQYQFEETSGTTAYDSTSNHYDAISVSEEGDPCVPLWSTGGKVGRCIDMDANDYYLLMPDEALNDNVTERITVSLWARWDSETLEDGTSGHVVSIWGGSGDTYTQILILSLGASRDDTKDDIGASISDRWEQGVGGDTGLWPGTEWNHLAYIKDANEKSMRIYCNGKLIAENDVEENPLAAPIDFSAFPSKEACIGVSPEPKDFDDWWKGYLDDLRIYNYVLSQPQVAYLVNGSTPLYIPLESKGDLYRKEAANSQAVNFRDFAVIAIDWCDEILWPVPR